MTKLVDMVLMLVAVATAPWWATRMVVRGRHRTDWRGRFGHANSLAAPPPGGRVLLHAVSVGEVGAIRGLVAALAERGDVDVVIASTTDTGAARAKELFGDRHTVVRWPLDFSWMVKRFLNATQPTVIGLVELEVWPNATAICEARGIPTVIVSGRLSARSHRRYRRIRCLIRPMFRRLAAVGAQNTDIARRFEDLGVPASRVQVVGNMKWDSISSSAGNHQDADQLADSLGIDRTKPVIVGGSTAPGEDQLLRDACPDNTQLVCAPRRPEWWDQAAETLAPCIRRSTPETPETPETPGTPGSPGTPRSPAPSRFLLDTIGELGSAYGFADIVVVGRSFGDLHGSDPVEPIAQGAATIIGPAVCDFQDSVELLRAGGGLVQCRSDELAGAIHSLLANPSARDELVRRGQQVIAEQQGATTRCLELLLAPARGETDEANCNRRQIL